MRVECVLGRMKSPSARSPKRLRSTFTLVRLMLYVDSARQGITSHLLCHTKERPLRCDSGHPLNPSVPSYTFLRVQLLVDGAIGVK